jgi:hypothetical protein
MSDELPPVKTPSSGYGTPAVHTPRFTASAVGPMTILTFFAFAGIRVGEAPELVPAFSAALTASDVGELRGVLDSVLMALQTLKADETKPQ